MVTCAPSHGASVHTSPLRGHYDMVPGSTLPDFDRCSWELPFSTHCCAFAALAEERVHDVHPHLPATAAAKRGAFDLHRRGAIDSSIGGGQAAEASRLPVLASSTSCEPSLQMCANLNDDDASPRLTAVTATSLPRAVTSSG